MATIVTEKSTLQADQGTTYLQGLLISGGQDSTTCQWQLSGNDGIGQVVMERVAKAKNCGKFPQA